MAVWWQSHLIYKLFQNDLPYCIRHPQNICQSFSREGGKTTSTNILPVKLANQTAASQQCETCRRVLQWAKLVSCSLWRKSIDHLLCLAIGVASLEFPAASWSQFGKSTGRTSARTALPLPTNNTPAVLDTSLIIEKRQVFEITFQRGKACCWYIEGL